MKRVRKLIPVSLYDIQGLESWLEDMSKRGLFLKKFGTVWCAFERGPARPLRYRVEPVREGELDDPWGRPSPMKELYQEFGWSYTASIGNSMFIFSTENKNAPEPHSDPELQSGLWKKLYRSRRRNFFVTLVIILFLLAAVPYMLFYRGMPVLVLLTTTAPILAVFLVLSLVWLPDLWADAQRLGLLVKQLEAGVPLDHRSAYPRRRWRELAKTVIFLALTTAIFIIQTVLPLTSGGARPLEDLTAFPALELTRLEGKELGFRGYSEERYIDGELRTVNFSNFCKQNHYLLCWNQWEVVQTGDIEPDGWVRMEINWYDLPGWLFPLSAPLARELLDEAMGLNRDIWWTDEGRDRVWTVHYYPREGAALLATASNGPGGFQIAAVSQGSRAAVVKYTGNGDLADHLDEIMAMVQ